MELINISNPNDGLGDKVRNAFNKVNLNFAEVISLISTIDLGANISDIVGLQDALDTLQGQTDTLNSQMLILQTNIDANNLSVADALSEIEGINTALLTIADDFIANTQKGVVNGVATLDGTGKIPISQLPALSITDTFPVSTQAQMLALTAERGDVAIRSDINKSFILRDEPATTLSNWSELLSPLAAVSSVAGKTGAVTLTKADVSLNAVDNTADSAKNVLSASKLTTARSINGVPFNGTTDITIPTGTSLTAGENIDITGNVISGAYNTFSTGKEGLVPARVGALATKYLREDGNWITPTNSTYTAGTKALLDAGTNGTAYLYSPLILNQWLNGKNFATSYYGYGLSSMDSGFIPTNLNTIMNTSILGFNAPSNSPYAYGSVWTHRRNATECTQIAIDILSDSISFRRQQSVSGWSGWRKIYHDGNLTPLEIEAVNDFNAPNGFKILYGSASSASNTPLGDWTNGIQFSANNNNEYFNQLVFDINGRLFTRTKTSNVIGSYKEVSTVETDLGYTTLFTPGLNGMTPFTTKILRFKIHNGFYIIDGEFTCNGTGSAGTQSNVTISDVLPRIDPETIETIKLDDYVGTESGCFSSIKLEKSGTQVFLKANLRLNTAGTTKFRATLPIVKQL